MTSDRRHKLVLKYGYRLLQWLVAIGRIKMAIETENHGPVVQVNNLRVIGGTRLIDRSCENSPYTMIWRHREMFRGKKKAIWPRRVGRFYSFYCRIRFFYHPNHFYHFIGAQEVKIPSELIPVGNFVRAQYRKNHRVAGVFLSVVTCPLTIDFVLCLRHIFLCWPDASTLFSNNQTWPRRANSRVQQRTHHSSYRGVTAEVVLRCQSLPLFYFFFNSCLGIERKQTVLQCVAKYKMTRQMLSMDCTSILKVVRYTNKSGRRYIFCGPLYS